MALSDLYKYETIDKTITVRGEEQTIKELVKVYDYRRELRRLQNLPENERKRRFLTNGTSLSGIYDNTTPIQQFVSVTDDQQVVGYFEYNIAKVASEETVPLMEQQYDEETQQIIEVPVIGVDGEPIQMPVFIDEYVATISEMMSFPEELSMTFGADLYHLLEHCFIDPIPQSVYEFLNTNKKNGNDTEIATIDLDATKYISTVEWFVFPHNPAAAIYDLLVIQMGGHIVLPQKQGNLKKYVLTRDEFLAKAYRGDPNDINL
jgi:hypothetical protein